MAGIPRVTTAVLWRTSVRCLHMCPTPPHHSLPSSLHAQPASGVLPFCGTPPFRSRVSPGVRYAHPFCSSIVGRRPSEWQMLCLWESLGTVPAHMSSPASPSLLLPQGDNPRCVVLPHPGGHPVRGCGNAPSRGTPCSGVVAPCVHTRILVVSGRKEGV